MNSANGKQLVFQALAQYHQSCENNEKKQIGEELARLQEATRLIQQAQSYLPTQSFASEFTIIQKAHDLARKDNDFIVIIRSFVLKLITFFCLVPRTNSRIANIECIAACDSIETDSTIDTNESTIQRYCLGTNRQ